MVRYVFLVYMSKIDLTWYLNIAYDVMKFKIMNSFKYFTVELSSDWFKTYPSYLTARQPVTNSDSSTKPLMVTYVGESRLPSLITILFIPD